MDIVLASGNRGKLAELAALLEPTGLTVRPQSDFAVTEAVESGQSFVENALIKARNAASATGLPALADDSGLTVDALDGAPGVRSARYAGERATDADNVIKLLGALQGVPPRRRGCAFVCVMAFLRHPADPLPLIATGVWRGRVLEAPRGDGGFGYDPVFFDPALGRAAAELDAASKNAVSHRGQALSALLAGLQAELGRP
ncbi:MAG: RdgB/HAM1 family non-canonical purine NTP pyrophosphatase [Gammaproteobacteria bacterium]